MGPEKKPAQRTEKNKKNEPQNEEDEPQTEEDEPQTEEDEPQTEEDELAPWTCDILPSVTLLTLESLFEEVCAQLTFCNLPLVTELRIERCIFPDINYLVEMLCAFPGLKKLKIKDMWFTSTDHKVDICTSEAKNELMSFPSLEALRFPAAFMMGEDPSMALTKWLFANSLHKQIKTLEISVVGRGNAELLRDFLEALGPDLEHFYFSVEAENFRSDMTTTPLTLTHCTGLRTLCFWSLKLSGAAKHPLYLAWVPLLLSELNAPHLKEIHFRFRAGGAEATDLVGFDWAQVDEILCDRRFEFLQRVTFETIRGVKLKDLLKPFLETRLPGLVERGIAVLKHNLTDGGNPIIQRLDGITTA